MKYRSKIVRIVRTITHLRPFNHFLFILTIDSPERPYCKTGVFPLLYLGRIAVIYTNQGRSVNFIDLNIRSFFPSNGLIDTNLRQRNVNPTRKQVRRFHID